MTEAKQSRLPVIAMIGSICAIAVAYAVYGGLLRSETHQGATMSLSTWTVYDQDDMDAVRLLTGPLEMSAAVNVKRWGVHEEEDAHSLLNARASEVVKLGELDSVTEVLEREAGERWRAACPACDAPVTLAEQDRR